MPNPNLISSTEAPAPQSPRLLQTRNSIYTILEDDFMVDHPEAYEGASLTDKSLAEAGYQIDYEGLNSGALRKQYPNGEYLAIRDGKPTGQGVRIVRAADFSDDIKIGVQDFEMVFYRNGETMLEVIERLVHKTIYVIREKVDEIDKGPHQRIVGA